MAFGAVGIFLLIALLSFRTDDLSFNSYSSESGVRQPRRQTRFAGGRSPPADRRPTSDLLPLALLYLAYRLLRFKEVRWRWYKWGAFLGLTVALSALFAFNLEFTSFLGQRVPTGGILGFKTAEILKTFLGVPGALLCSSPCWPLPSWSSPAFPSSSLPTGGSSPWGRNGAGSGKGGRSTASS